MFRTVLVPIDGTPMAEHAVPWAVAAAGPSGTVHLVHCHVPPTPLMVEGVVMTDPTLDKTLRESEVDYLAGLTARVRQAAPQVAVDARNLDTEDLPADALAAAVTATGSELVVMATHGRGPFARFWLGSTTHELVRVSPVPVLTVRPPEEVQAHLAARPRVGRVVVPVDGTELSEAILPWASRFAEMFGAGVERMEAVHHGSPAAAILDFARGSAATVIAMTTHARSGVSRLLHGSVADEVIRKAVGPVLVYHPPE